jgi:hypothetical protein
MYFSEFSDSIFVFPVVVGAVLSAYDRRCEPMPLFRELRARLLARVNRMHSDIMRT